MADKKTVAVFFGGNSVEHDVSVLTGLHAIEAIDATSYQVLPIYIAPQGGWFSGASLLKRKNYPLKLNQANELIKLTPLFTSSNDRERQGKLLFAQEQAKGLFKRKPISIEADIALPALHGGVGENGSLQGLFETYQVPYIGCEVLSSALCMDKVMAKQCFQMFSLPAVPGISIEQPSESYLIGEDILAKKLAGLEFPYCVKPCNLGSSVAVTRANSMAELQAALANIFHFDKVAIIERLVPNLVEYNVAVTKAFGKVQISAIERPLGEKPVLSFADKYRQGDAGDSKLLSAPSAQAMSDSRVINPPEINSALAEKIRDIACTSFTRLNCRGAVRMDFLCDSKSQEIWLNEVNTVPGSFAYYLWEAATPPVTYTELLTALIEEGFTAFRQQKRSTDPRSAKADLFTYN